MAQWKCKFWKVLRIYNMLRKAPRFGDFWWMSHVFKKQVAQCLKISSQLVSDVTFLSLAKKALWGKSAKNQKAWSWGECE